MNNNKKNDVGEVDALRGDNARLRARVQDLTTYIDGRKLQWEQLAERLRRERRAIQDLETAVGVRDARITGYARETARLQRRIEGQRREIDLLRDRLTHAPRGSATPARSASMPPDAEAKIILRAAYDKLASMRQEQRRLSAELDDRNEYIDRLCSKLAALEVERNETNATLRRQRRIIDHIEGEIRTRLTRVALENRRQPRQSPASATPPLPAQHDAGAVPPASANSIGLGARLTLLAESERDVDFEIGTRTLTIGRGAHNDIRIRRESVSREHARLTPASDGVVIEDLCSRNGTCVNDKRVARQLLRSGDIVVVGHVRFRFSQAVVPFTRNNAS